LSFIGGLLVFTILAATVPAMYSPEQQYQARFLNNNRLVFTTLFYWYQVGGGGFMSYWDNATIESVNNMNFPADWPGPRDGESMVVDGHWHDIVSHHPPAEEPAYNTIGDVVGELKTGTGTNITSWVSWQNPGWHEWQLRGMVRAGIDAVLPVYWYNGIDHYWAYGGLETLVGTWHNLTQKVADEANARDGGLRTIEYGRSVLPKIGMFFDTTCMKQLWLHNQTDPDWAWTHGSGPNLNDPYWKDAFWQRIDDFYTVVDPVSALTVDGRSNVVWLYLTDWFEDIGSDILRYCKERFEQKYNRSLLFIGPNAWNKAGVDGNCDWGSSFGAFYPSPRGIPVGAVSPGFYNIGALPQQEPKYKERSFQRYMDEWKSLIYSSTAWVHVETWNELHEGTDIAWSQEYGYAWIDATRQMTDLFHSTPWSNYTVGINITGILTCVVILIAFVGIGWYLAKRGTPLNT
jgi:hypothetical protein